MGNVDKIPDKEWIKIQDDKLEKRNNILEKVKLITDAKDSSFFLTIKELEKIFKENSDLLADSGFRNTDTFISAFSGGIKEIRQKLGLRAFK